MTPLSSIDKLNVLIKCLYLSSVFQRLLVDRPQAHGRIIADLPG